MEKEEEKREEEKGKEERGKEKEGGRDKTLFLFQIAISYSFTQRNYQSQVYVST